MVKALDFNSNVPGTNPIFACSTSVQGAVKPMQITAYLFFSVSLTCASAHTCTVPHVKEKFHIYIPFTTRLTFLFGNLVTHAHKVPRPCLFASILKLMLIQLRSL